MKKKLSILLAGLALCASITLLNYNSAEASKNPCIYPSIKGETGTWLQGSCYGDGNTCDANICI